jgi:DNA-binding response OmpR family regulator
MVLKQDSFAQNIPLLFLTSVTDPEEGLRMGAVGFMIRPEGTGRLLTAIDAVLVSGISPSSRVLIIEPDDATRESMILMIQAQGYRVTEARGAEEAIALAERIEPGLALVNSELAHDRDYWLLRSLRQIADEMDIFVLADVMSEEEGRAALSRGASGYSQTGKLREILEDRRDRPLGLEG